jgi:hypothetical protein
MIQMGKVARRHLVVACIVICFATAGSAWAECEADCDNCAADPVFIQRDQRQTDFVKAVLRAKAEGRHKVVTMANGEVVLIEVPKVPRRPGPCAA